MRPAKMTGEGQSLRTVTSMNEQPVPNKKQDNSGCLVLFLIGLPLVDAFGVIIAGGGQSAPLLSALGVVGFVLGAATGGVISVKLKHQSWYSSCRWAICGIIGALIASGGFLAVISNFARR
jgi:hypothetical protein